jgi:hypothetical protein
MEPFAELAKKVIGSFEGKPIVSYPFNPEKQAEDSGSFQFVLPSEARLCLGAAPFEGIDGFFASRETLLDEGTYLLGKELSGLQENGPYAKLVFITLKKSFPFEEEKAYSLLREIKFTEYHLSPKGAMFSQAPFEKRETLVVSRQAELSFESIGNAAIAAYHQHPEVSKVAVVFIVDSHFDYQNLAKETELSEKTLEALDHILHGIKMDCSTCKEKAICDEVEGLRQLHKKTSGQN